MFMKHCPVCARLWKQKRLKAKVITAVREENAVRELQCKHITGCDKMQVEGCRWRDQGGLIGGTLKVIWEGLRPALMNLEA